jgi:hypothetical protein
MRGSPVDNRGYSGKGRRAGAVLRAPLGFFARLLQPLLRRPLVLVILIVVVLIAVLIALASFAGSCARRDPELLPIENVANSTSGVSAEEVGANLDVIAQQMQENARYGPFELKVEVVEGASWLVVNVDGQEVYAGVAEPGFLQVYTVSTDARVEAAAPGYVKLYRNEEAVELVLEDGLGIAELKVEQKPVESNANSGTAPNANSASASASSSASDSAAAANAGG